MADKRISQLIERVTIANNDVLPIVASGATTTNKVTVSTLQDWMQSNLDVGVTSIGITIGTSGTNINVTGSPVTTSGNITINIPTASATNRGVLSSTDWTTFNNKLSSVGLTMPSAFTVTNSPLTANGTIAVTGAGTVGQYIRGDGSLADFPSSGGGGASVSYYLNGSVSQGTIGGVAYLEMNKNPVLGAGTNFSINANGYIASFITDAGDPSLLEIPGGNWNFESYFQASSGGGTPSFYIELYKVNSGGTATLIASNSSNPELIAFGTTTTAYFSTLAVPNTTLALTDRLAVRFYVTHSGRTITMHTENSNLCQVITTFTTGLTALNGLTAQVQNFATGTSGTDFAISSAGSTHTFNLPDASATARGVVTTGSQTIAGIKTFSSNMNADGGVRLPAAGTALPTFVNNISGSGLSSSGSNGFGFNNANNFYFSGSNKGGSVFVVNNTATRNYTFQDTSGVVALTSDLNSYVPTTRTITINGTSQDLSANRTYNVGTVTSVGLTSATSGVTIGSSPITSSGNITISIATATSTQNGLLSSTDWSTFNNKQNAITLTTTGTSGAATLVGSTLNIPQYQSVLTNPITGTGTINQIPKFSGTSTLTNSNISDNGTEVNIQSRIFVTSGGQQFVFTPNLATTSNRIETTGLLPLEIVSGGNIRFAAGGTTPQITLATTGVVTLTGALNGNTATFLSGSSSTIGLIVGGAGGSGATRQGQIRFGDAGTVYKIQGGEDYSAINFMIGSGTPLSLSSTGAATFSSSVTAGGNIRTDGGTVQVGAGSTNYFTRLATAYNYPYVDSYLDSMAGVSYDGRLTFRIQRNGGAVNSIMTLMPEGNVGIGTASPNARLSLGNQVSAQKFLMYDNNDNFKYGLGIQTDEFRQFYPSNGSLTFGTVSTSDGSTFTERMRINSSGDIGIGTSSPGYRLDIQNSSSFDTRLKTTSLGGTVGILFESNNNFSGTSQAYVKSLLGSGNGQSTIIFGTATNVGDTTASEKMRITPSGNVGIGTSSPGQRLTVSNAANGNIALFTNTIDADFLINLTSGVTLLTPSTGTLALGTSNTERMRITSGGFVLVNRTTTLNNGWLEVNGDGSRSALACNQVSTASSAQIYFSNPNGIVGSIFTSGTGTSYNTSSDYRLKENVKPVENALSVLTQLKPCTFNFIADADEEVMGFIAHEVQEVIPQAVTGEKDGFKIEEVEVSPAELDEEGNVITEAVIEDKEVPVYQGIDHSKLVPLLVAAIQEQQEQIKSLTEQVEALKSQING